jgi:predicted nucleotidyltransferase
MRKCKKDELIASLARLFSRRDDVCLALLFGSRAMDQASDCSDVDLAVLFRSEPALLDLGGLVSAVESEVGMKADLVELLGLPERDPLLAYRIAAQGLVIKADSPSDSINFKTRAFTAYFDAAPFLTNMHEAFARRIETGSFGKAIHA